MPIVVVNGKKYYVRPSTQNNKQYMVKVGKKTVHFADPKMPEYPGTKRGDSYCARSYGIKGKGDINSANYWSRKLWSCKGKKSISKSKWR